MRKAQSRFWLGLLALVGCSLYSGLPGFAADRQLQIAPVSAAPGGERRIALIIGNSAYKTSPLKNPVNDARAIAKALAGTGFSVTVLEDGSQAAMRRAMRVFGDELQRGGVGLFYFAGHGMQVRGKNYLIPVNADIEREDEVEDQAVDANVIMSKMDSAKNSLNLMILDACRNNPFARSFRSGAQGLAQMDAPSGTLVAFATAPGSVANDGDGVNGLYTKHFLANLNKPGLPIEQLFKEVRIGVTKETGDRQVPWESSSLKGNFFFVPGAATLSGEDQRREIEKTVTERLATERAEQQKQMERVIQDMLAKQRAAMEEEMKKRGEVVSAAAPKPAAAALAAPVPAAPVFDRSQMELSFWDSIKGSSNPEDFKAYLAQYPQGTFAALARSRANPAPQAIVAAVQAAPKPAAPAIQALKPIEPPKPSAAPAPIQVASAAPTSMIGMGIDDPRFPRIGDLWEYSYLDATTKLKKEARFEVTAVSKDGILEAGGFTDVRPAVRAHAAGAHLVFMGNILQLSPYLLSFGSIKEGDSLGNMRPEGDARCMQAAMTCRYEGKVVGREKITIRGGSFDTVKIVVDANVAFGSQNTWRQHTYWYSEDAKRVVKTMVRTRAGMSQSADYDLELTSYIPASQRTPSSAGVQLASSAPTTAIGTGIDDPRYPKVGDQWEYSYLDIATKIRKKMKIEISSVTKESIAETAEHDGDQRAYSPGHVLVSNRMWLEFSPYLLSFGSPKTGESWSLQRAENLWICQRQNASCRFDLKVIGAEKVTTPAGTFDAVKIEMDWNGNLTGQGANNSPAWRRITYWYAESVKRLVKSTVRTRNGYTAEPDYDVELMSYKLN